LAGIADIADTTQITFAASSPHVLIPNDFRVTGNTGFNSAPTSGVLVNMSPGIDLTGNYNLLRMSPILALNSNTLTIDALFGVMQGRPDGGTSGHVIRGLNFQAQLVGTNLTDGETGSASKLTAIAATPAVFMFHFDANTRTLNLTDLYGIEVSFSVTYSNPGSGSALGGVTNAVGVKINDPNSAKISNYTALDIDDEVNATGNIYLMEIGPATPYLRCLGNFTAAANETPLYISEGATPTLRQLKTKDGAAIGGGDLVCVLV
jgi:hypothetical protein